MEIVIRRTDKTSKSTISPLAIMGNPFTCFTLEDQDRGLSKNMPLSEIQSAKVFGRTAIPSGRYQVTIDHSTRFGHDMPHILDVPGFEGVRIHSGNTDADTEGCLLVGLEKGTDIVTSSRLAFTQFYILLKQAIDKGETVYITIV